MTTGDRSQLQKNIVDGTFFTDRRDRSILNYEHLANRSLPGVFRRYVVLDVITNRLLLTTEKMKEFESRFGELQNSIHASQSIVPRNTIIAKPLYDSSSDNKMIARKPVFLYPLFPSHLALPCKPGEHVWVMFESLTEEHSLGYWVCRIVGPDHVDDVNHSHAPREYDVTFSKEAINSSSDQEAGNPADPTSKVKPRYHYKNGIYKRVLVDDLTGVVESVVDAVTSFILPHNDKSDISSLYEDILLNSDGAKKIIYEPVPRFVKEPGDVAIEGSNNSLIVLGVDPAASIANSTNRNSITTKSAGTIDMVVGRGTTPDTFGEIATTELGGTELAKHYSSLKEKEGAPDYTNDRSRIFISQKSKVNNRFKLTTYNETNAVPNTPSRPLVTDSADGDAAIVIKSDKVKIVARSDIQFIVQGFDEGQSVVGDNIKNEKSNINSWASITIKSNGDIIFTPSNLGYIKLGGDDADRALVCTAQPAILNQGVIYGTAVQNTAGGQMAGSQGVDPQGRSLSPIASGGVPSTMHGTFAAKVLVK